MRLVVNSVEIGELLTHAQMIQSRRPTRHAKGTARIHPTTFPRSISAKMKVSMGILPVKLIYVWKAGVEAIFPTEKV